MVPVYLRHLVSPFPKAETENISEEGEEMEEDDDDEDEEEDWYLYISGTWSPIYIPLHPCLSYI